MANDTNNSPMWLEATTLSGTTVTETVSIIQIAWVSTAGHPISRSDDVVVKDQTGVTIWACRSAGTGTSTIAAQSSFAVPFVTNGLAVTTLDGGVVLVYTL